MILGWHLDAPWTLIGLLIVLPIFLMATFIFRKRQLFDYPPLQHQKPKKAHKIIFGAHTILITLMLSSLFVSLANPYKTTEMISIEENGIDILVTCDVSSSMQATDFSPTRLEATKKIVSDFVRRSHGHRIGMLVFGKHVFTLSPMTTDHLFLQDLIDGLSLNTIDHELSGGTALGDGLLRSVDILRNIKTEGRSQVVILLTDGDNNYGVEPELAAKFAKKYGIKVYTIGIGSTELIDVYPDPQDKSFSFKSQLVEAPLEKIAQITGGQYYHAVNQQILQQIFIEISKLEQTPLEIDRVSQKKYERFPFNLTAALCFIAAFILQVLFIRRPLR